MVFRLSALLMLLLLTGCGDKFGGRVPISGKITVKGQVLADGVIYFEPLEKQGSQGNSPITNGEYRLEGIEGLQAGKYLVRISAADKATTVNEADAGGPGGSANVTFFDFIPPEWNVSSKQEITVVKDAKNEFNFDIPNRLEPKRKR